MPVRHVLPTLLCLMTALTAAELPTRLPAIRSEAMMVVDPARGEVLMEKNGDSPMPIASITKLMTAMVVVDAGLDPSEPCTIQAEDTDQIRRSRSRLPVGTQLTRGEALRLALMASENRAAHALGRTYPGGVRACVAAMNAKASALGLRDTHFEDPTGLSGGNVASARDLTRLVAAAARYPAIHDATTTPEMTLLAGRRQLAFGNTNPMVRNPQWHIDISKTGYLEEAGRCLVMQAQASGRTLCMVFLKSWGRFTRVGDATRVLNWVEGRHATQGPTPRFVRAVRGRRATSVLKKRAVTSPRAKAMPKRAKTLRHAARR